MHKPTLICAVICSLLIACPSDDASEGNDELGGTATETGETSDSGSSTDSTATDSNSTSSTNTDTTDASSTDSSTSDSTDTMDASSTDSSTTNADTTDTSSTDTSSTDGVEPGCGDGSVDPGEACDDGNIDDGDGCSSACEFEARLAFVTSTLHTGNLGGLVGGDAICNLRAAQAGLPGTYMAWLSSAQDSPSTRFVQSTVPYVKVDGVKIADDWTDLSDGTLDAAITKTETGGTPPNSTYICNGTARQSWTGTAVDGTALANTCSDFTSTGSNGAIGRNTGADANWSLCNPSVACTNMAPLYCFQQ